jgi:hypothetical protein
MSALLRPYLKDPRVRYVCNRRALGAQRNLTKLVAAAQAPYLTLLHHDDRWHADFLARRVNFLRKNPNCGFVFGESIDIDQGGRELRRPESRLREGLHDPDAFVPTLLSRHLVGPPSTLIRTSAFNAVGPYFDERFVVFDLEVWLRLALRFPVGYLKVWDSEYRWHDEQLSKRAEWGKQGILFEDHLDTLLQRADLAVGRAVGSRVHKRAEALLSAAMDAAEAGHRGEALKRLGEAGHLRPRAILNPRTAATIFSAAAGGLGRRWLRRLRVWTTRRRSGFR